MGDTFDDDDAEVRLKRIAYSSQQQAMSCIYLIILCEMMLSLMAWELVRVS